MKIILVIIHFSDSSLVNLIAKNFKLLLSSSVHNFYLNIPKYFSISLIIGLVSLIIGIYFEFSYEIIFVIAILISIIASGVAIYPHWNKPVFVTKKSDDINASKQNKSELMISVSATLYAVLAGLSLVITIEFVFQSIIDDLNSLDMSILLLSHETLQNIIFSNSIEILIAVGFLSTAIPFYHGAMVYLSDKSRNIEIETDGGLIFHFSVLFIEAILLIGIASSLSSLTMVVTLLILLQVFDAFWIIFGQKTENKPPLGWLALNLGFSSALIFSLHLNSIPESIYLFFGISLVRMIIDYVGFKKIYMDKTEIS